VPATVVLYNGHKTAVECAEIILLVAEDSEVKTHFQNDLMYVEWSGKSGSLTNIYAKSKICV